MSNAKREDILRRIKALRDKTTTNGCTEAEAMSAMSKMEQLMHEYNVSHADLSDIDEAQFGAMRAKAGIVSKTRTTWHPAVIICGGAIIRMCGCKYYRSDGEYIVFGERGDCETAVYLIDLVTTTADRAWREYWAKAKNGEDHAARERASFMHGFGGRVAKEAINIQSERHKQREAAKGTNDCTALMLVKKDAIVKSRWDTYLRSKGIRLVSRSGSRTTSSSNAYGAGNSAGGRVSFGGGGARISSGARRLTQ